MKNKYRTASSPFSLIPAWIALPAVFFAVPPMSGADFGDAPDGTDTFYPVAPGQSAIVGQFPTLLASNGARHSNLNDAWLGGMDSQPSSEVGANDPADSDGLPNLVNNDANDDGLPAIPFFLVPGPSTVTATLSVLVTVAPGAPAMDRRLNILIDWDQSGDWQNAGGGAAPEWAVQNHPVNVTPGTTQLISIPIQWGLGTQLGPQIFWTRVTLSRATIPPASYPNGWDGSGSFTYGETEDFLFHPNQRHDVAGGPWIPPANPAPGNPPPAPANLPSISLIPKDQTVSHGRTGTVTVNLDNGSAPATLEWAVDPAQRGGFLFDPGMPKQPFGGSYTVAGTTATASAGGVPPALGIINITSLVDPRTPAMEEWPLRVRARWPGVRTQTRKAVVRIWHSGWSSVFAVTSNFKALEAQLLETIPPAEQGPAMAAFAETFDLYRASETFFASLTSLDLDSAIDELLIEAFISPVDAELLKELNADLRVAYTNLGEFFGPPVPILDSPVDADTLSGTANLLASTASPDIESAIFFYSLDGTTWEEIGVDTEGPVYSTSFNTTGLPDGTVRLRVEMQDLYAASGDFEALVWIDNSAPVPSLAGPVDASIQAGIVPVMVNSDLDDDLTAVMELSPNGTDWHVIGTDADAGDGHDTLLDVGQLPGGPYAVRATVTDAYGNSNSADWSISVEPSFHAWRNQLGVPTAQAEDDLDFDGLNLGTEYALALSATDLEAQADVILWEPLGGTDFQLRFTPASFVDGLRIFVEESTNASTWTPILSDPDTSGEVVVPVDTDPMRLVRLRFEEDRP